MKTIQTMLTKFYSLMLVAVLFCSCTSNQSNSSSDTDAGKEKKDIVSYTNDTAKNQNLNDPAATTLGDSILTIIKRGEYARLTEFIDPATGIRLSPYGHVDTSKNLLLSEPQFLDLVKTQRTVNWGTSQGSGDPINLTLNDYFKKFVYDADFVHAEKVSVNKIIGPDSLSSNLTPVYPDCSFVQYYFSGLNKKYEGMDWKSLTLVFKKDGDKNFLVGLVHDQWKG
jgi:hypothetical protein